MVKIWSSALAIVAALVFSQTSAQDNGAGTGVTVDGSIQVNTFATGSARKPESAPAATPAPQANATAASGKGTNPLVIKGYRFFDSVTGKYFPMRGVNYYPRPNAGTMDANNLDLFTEKYKHIWGRDVPQFVALNANAIRLYAVDPDGDHTSFMCALQSAGIYVIVDLGSSCLGCEITADKAPACYPASYKKRGEKIIQNFSKYDNVIGFSGGNEINHRTGGNGPEWNAPCQKKFVRDMRAYIKSCPKMRQIPVGLVMADTNRDDNAKYYNCRTNPADELENAEWYGINVYVHCSNSDDPDVGSGFGALAKSFAGYKYSIPTILTEFGCTSPDFPPADGFNAQRTFHDAKWMNSKKYSEIFNGGFAFEYTTENANSKSTSAYPFTKFGPQNYGLGYLCPENCDEITTKCEFKRFPNFYNLAKAYMATESSGEPTLKTFEPASDRRARSVCPPKWPKLADLVWPSDAAKSEICPQVTRYQCPAVPLSQAPINFEQTKAENAPPVSAEKTMTEATSDAVQDTSPKDTTVADTADKKPKGGAGAVGVSAIALSTAAAVTLML